MLARVGGFHMTARRNLKNFKNRILFPIGLSNKVATNEEQVNVACFCSSGRFVGGTKREKLALSLKLDSSVPLFSQSTLAIDNVRLAEDSRLPKANIGLWKVAKNFSFLSHF
jgi:hypothetical protein